jgi:hypothetical protein
VRAAAMPVRVVRKVLRRDGEDPGYEVGVGLKGVEGAEGFGESLLYEVFGLGWIAGEPESVVVERGEKWERELFEGSAAVDGGRHGAVCLVVDATTEFQRSGRNNLLPSTEEQLYCKPTIAPQAGRQQPA